ncbi:hypothetical protein SOVF_120160 [Spinacia oleracea]|nr:hypothetical protein SOVF_120160 [Spinacia oleracea]
MALVNKQPTRPLFASIIRGDPYLVVGKCPSPLGWIFEIK